MSGKKIHGGTCDFNKNTIIQNAAASASSGPAGELPTPYSGFYANLGASQKLGIPLTPPPTGFSTGNIDSSQFNNGGKLEIVNLN